MGKGLMETFLWEGPAPCHDAISHRLLKGEATMSSRRLALLKFGNQHLQQKSCRPRSGSSRPYSGNRPRSGTQEMMSGSQAMMMCGEAVLLASGHDWQDSFVASTL